MKNKKGYKPAQQQTTLIMPRVIDAMLYPFVGCGFSSDTEYVRLSSEAFISSLSTVYLSSISVK